MRMTLPQTLVAFVALICLPLAAPAEGLRLMGQSRGPLGQSSNRGFDPNIRQMEYLSDVEAANEYLPDGNAPMSHPMYESMHGCGQGCPSCGDCCQQGDCCCPQSSCCCPQCAGGCSSGRGMFYSETQLMLLRAHVAEEVVGKLSESHEFSPRFIFGYESCSGLGARARYWMYDEEVPILNGTGTELGLDWTVIDVEGTARFRTDRADLIFGCGFRWADANIEQDQFSISSDMPGITLALDGRAWICQSCVSQGSAVAGARWSIRGGDWEGDNVQGGPIRWRDDNIVVQELYGGFEYLRYYGNWNVFARLVFEAQNWQSDALGTNNIGIGAQPNTDYSLKSIGFLGPGIHVGATY
jgi:hypothetical protein